MKTLKNKLAITFTALLFATTSSAAIANITSQKSTLDITTYEVLHVENIDLIAQQTQHVLNQLNYERYLDVQNQATDNIAYIGARLHLNQQPRLVKAVDTITAQEAK